jgi:hypothetical protein
MSRSEELGRSIYDRLNEIEEQIAGMVPTTIQGCLIQLRLLKARWESQPDELDDRLVENMLARLRQRPRAAGDRPGALRGMLSGGFNVSCRES